MPAQANHTVWTAFLSPVTDTVARGKCLCLDAAGEYYVIATLANRTAASRSTCVSGVAITAGSSTNRAVEMQTVGPLPPDISGLEAGDAGPIIVNNDGELERKASPTVSDIVAGKCDADGWAYLNLTSRDGGVGATPSVTGTGFWRSVSGALQGAATAIDLAGGSTHVTGVLPVANGGTGLSAVGSSGNVLTSNGTVWTSSALPATITVNGATKDLLFKTSATVIDPIGTGIWTREASGRVNVTTSGWMTFGAAGATYPSAGLIRVPAVGGSDIVLFESASGNVFRLTPSGMTIGSAGTGPVTIANSLTADNTTVDALNSLSYVDATTFMQSPYYESPTTPAQSGLMRATNNTTAVASRNASNSGDLALLGTNSSNETLVGNSANPTKFTGQVHYAGTRMSIKSVPGEVQTSSTSVTTVASYTMTDDTFCQFDAIVTFARQSAVTKAGTYKVSVGYRRTAAGAPTIVGALVTQTEQETEAGNTVTVDVSSNDVRIRVTAADTDARNWGCELRVQEMTDAA